MTVSVRITKHHNMFLMGIGVAAAAVTIALAPSASAAPNGQPCANAGESTSCQRPASAQVYTAPQAMPRVFPPSINPRWRGVGYSARFPKYGFDPKWQAFGYNPLYSGFQPRPSVLRPFQLPDTQAVRCPTPSHSACTPAETEPTDTGGS